MVKLLDLRDLLSNIEQLRHECVIAEQERKGVVTNGEAKRQAKAD